MRSVVVVLPASMWAMMPILRVSLSGTCLAMMLRLSSRAVRRVFAAAVKSTSSYRFRVRSSFICLRCGGRQVPADEPGGPAGSPAIVGKRLVGLRHPVRVFLLLDRASPALGGVHQLAGQPGPHRLLTAALRDGDDPAHREGELAAGPHFHRHLGGRPADAA